MFLTTNTLEFIDRVRIFYNQIVVNICNNTLYDPIYIRLISEKQIFLFVTDNDIENIIQINNNMTIDYIKKNLDSKLVISLFDNLFNQELIKYKENFYKNISNSQFELYKNQYPEYIDFDNLIFKVRLCKKKYNKIEPKLDSKINDDIKLNTNLNFESKYNRQDAISEVNEDTISDVNEDTISDVNKDIISDVNKDIISDVNENTVGKINEDNIGKINEDNIDKINEDNVGKINEGYNKNHVNYDNKQYDSKIKINFKYKIRSPYLDNPFELFMVGYNDFFATVQTFHLPCVRSYYNGTNVYLTPTCITAHLTHMNLDYKYFAGTVDPVEIINKYRMRGFGTWLNEYEKYIYLKYSENEKFWKNLLSINFNNSKTIEAILGSLSPDHKIFQPRLYNSDDFYDNTPVDLDVKYNLILLKGECCKINTRKEYFDEIDNRTNMENNPISYMFDNIQTINEKGSIDPIKKWVIEAAWEIMNTSVVKKEPQLLKFVNYNRYNGYK
jgi:hypothetical protein